MIRPGWPAQWSLESSNLPLLRWGQSLPQHPNTGDSISSLSVWLRWGLGLQSYDSTSDRKILWSMWSNHHRKAADYTDCAGLYPHPGGQGGGRFSWSSHWTVPPSNQLRCHQLLWRRELNIFISEGVKSNILVFVNYSDFHNINWAFLEVKVFWGHTVSVNPDKKQYWGNIPTWFSWFHEHCCQDDDCQQTEERETSTKHQLLLCSIRSL